ncbi:phosphate signaling complex protein PhoU [Candidatus Pelagibacter sp.]|jgi:phosphate transport system protein|nr:phosphate signaling complex protein PhoU [Candidatus Pelagibacter sp.]|tara:strand:- start:369 stop:1076 length:708 start_codon:yes stop_codon:yes gene_type:complete
MTEAPHTVKSYEEELKNLNSNIIKMGGFCEKSLGKAIQAITTRNSDNAESVIKDDEKIDKFETLIEQQVVNLIALRQPMAIDLRETVTALKISSDLERIGDLAKNISKRTLLLNENLPKNLVDAIIRVSSDVQKQLKSILDAYLERSSAMAINVWESDEQIDDLTNFCMQEVIKYLKENEKNLSDGTHLLFVTKNIERIGDHTTNIAEQVYYLVKGEYLEGDRPKGTEPIVTGEK